MATCRPARSSINRELAIPEQRRGQRGPHAGDVQNTGRLDADHERVRTVTVHHDHDITTGRAQRFAGVVLQAADIHQVRRGLRHAPRTGLACLARPFWVSRVSWPRCGG
jgi:hypothetical protein